MKTKRYTKKSKLTLTLVCALLILSCQLIADEKGVLRRIEAHLLIGDYRQALRECKTALIQYPQSEPLRRVFIQTLGESGEDIRALKAWKKWDFSLEDTALMETIAWGILERSGKSPQLTIPLIAMSSAAATTDVRAVALLAKQLESKNAFLRAVAAKLAASYWDALLIEKLLTLLKEERVWFVRLEVIGALGAMEVKAAKKELEKIATSRSSLREKTAAIHALLSMYEVISEREFLQLIKSKKGGLRHLACNIVAHLDWKAKRKEIASLLSDPSSDVRIAALNTLYLLGLKDLDLGILTRLSTLMKDPNPFVAITAAFITLRFDPKEANKILRKHIYSEDGAVRRLAACALSRAGSAGLPLAKEALKISQDPFVRVNIALGLAQNSKEKKLGCDEIYTFLMLFKERVMWESEINPLMKPLGPTRVHHTPQAPSYPLMIDQLTRLEIFTLLATLDDVRAEEGLKGFLSRPLLGVSYSAAMALVEEGKEEIFIILQRLLEDENELIRIQAAVVLAFSGYERVAIKALQEAYSKAEREMKITILTALGHLGSRHSIPYLFALLDEPSEVLKVVAAAALIQCLYH